MKKNLKLIYNFLIGLSLGILIAGSVFAFIYPMSNFTRFLSIQEAKIGTALLFIFLIMKSLYLLFKKRNNALIRFLRVNNTFQREQGIIAFILIAGHFVIELIKSFGTSILIAEIVSILIPTIVLIYMAITSIRGVQKKHKHWKRNHTLIWLTIPLILVHILLVGKMRVIYLILAGLLIIIALVEIFLINERGKKHALLILIGSALSVITFGALSTKLILEEPAPVTPSNPAPSTPNSNNNNTTPSNSTTYVDGTYQGSGSGYEGPITVEVVVTNQVISSVTVIDENESRPLNAFRVIPPEIVQNNGTTDVQTITGATFTSNAIISATEEALSKAQ